MGNKKLTGEIAIVTGSDSGIGQATAIAFARESADVAVTYLEDRKGADWLQVMPSISTARPYFIDGGLTQNMGQGA